MVYATYFFFNSIHNQAVWAIKFEHILLNSRSIYFKERQEMEGFTQHLQ